MLKKKISNQKTVEELIAPGRQAREHGRLTDAIRHYRSALDLGLSSADEEASVRCLLAEALEKAGRSSELRNTVAKYDHPAGLRHLSRQTEIQVLIRLGWSCSINNDIPRSVALFNQVLRIAQPDETGIIAACHLGLGRAYRVYSEIQFARDHYAIAIEGYRRIGDLAKLAESYLGMAYVDLREGEYQECITSVKVALSLLRGSSDACARGAAYDFLAAVSFYIEDLTALPGIFSNCLENARPTGALITVMNASNNYGMTLIVTGDWALGEEVVKDAIEASIQMSNPVYVANNQETLAQIYLLMGRISEADELLTTSLGLTTSAAAGEWVEINIQVSMGKSCLLKGQTDQAITHFQRSLEICERMGNYQFRPDGQVGLSEALMEGGKVEEAKAVIKTALSDLRRSPNIDAWGYLTRTIARYELSQGRVTKAIQSLNQSSSVFELRGGAYGLAVNRIVMAKILESSGELGRAVSETETALTVFEKLGAIDAAKTKVYLDKLKNRQAGNNELIESTKLQTSVAAGTSILDDFVTERLLDASFSRKLLLRELASISKEQTAARGVIVVEITKDHEGSVAVSIGIEEQEQQKLTKQIASLRSGGSDRDFVYEFSDNDKSIFLLHIIGPTAENFIAGHIDIKPLLYLVENGLQKQFLKSQVRRRPAFDPAQILAEAEVSGFICKGPAMTKVLEQIHKIRSSNAAVLITGESGSGKELVARAVHAASARKFGTFLPFNCSSVSGEMVESQLFGFRKGAFTGASANSEGVIRAAEHGTLFLDEIGEMPIDLQPKLLRFLQEGEIHPLGESKPIKVDVRLVAATNVDLEQEVAKGKFREDLFYRLNVIRVHVPPLRERREEIPVLIAYYLKQYQQEEGKTDIALSQEAIDLMIVYDWPGNVRQLCNELRRLIAYNESGTTLNVDSLSSEIVGPGQVWFSKPEKSKTEPDLSLVDSKQTLAEATDDLERNMIQAALRRSSGNIAQAAKELGLSRGGLYLKMNRLKLQA